MTSFNLLGGGVVAQESNERMRVANDRWKELEVLAQQSRDTLDEVDDGLDRIGDDDFLSGLASQSAIDWIPGLRTFLSLPWVPTSEVPAQLDCGFTKARHTVFLTFSEPDSKVGAIAFFLTATAIVTSIVSFCVSTFTDYRRRAVQGIAGTAEQVFTTIEVVCVTIFTIEYLSRFLTATAVPSAYERAYAARYGWKAVGTRPCPLAWRFTPAGFVDMIRTSLWKLLRFVLAPLNIIDAVAIAPFYYSMLSSSDVAGNLLIIRVLRLARVFRLARMSKRMEGVQILASTMVTAVDALGFLAFFLLLAVVMFGTVIFFCEGGEYDARLDDFVRPNMLGTAMEPSPFKSIPHAFWWTVVTMTTVGYGDMYPTTPAGRALGSFIMLCGILVLALPITVVGSAFTEEYAKYKERRLMQMIKDEEKKQNDYQDEQDAQKASAAAAASTSTDPSGPPMQGGLKVTDDPAADRQQVGGERLREGNSTAVETSQGQTAAQLVPQSQAIPRSASLEGSREQHVVAVENSVPASPLLAPTLRQSSRRGLASLLGTVRSLGLRTSHRSSMSPMLSGTPAGSVEHMTTEQAGEEAGDGKESVASPRNSQGRWTPKPAMSKSARRELDLLVAMRRGRARLQAISSMEQAFKSGRIPLTAEAVYSGQVGSTIGPLSIASPLGLAAENTAAIGEVADQLSKQLEAQQSAAQKDTARVQALLDAQARDVSKLKEDVATIKDALNTLLQAVQQGQVVPHLPGSVH